MKRLLFLMLVMMSVSCGCFAQMTDDEKYEQARVLYNSEQYAKALPILNELEQRNHAKALNVLGLCYQYGRGVKKDVDKAYNYYMRSAEQGYCYGQRNLAWLYTDDTYMELHPEKAPDYKQMELWLRKAAKQNADIMYELARFYLDMQVMDEWQNKDYDAYLRKAAEGGSAEALACLGYDQMCEKDYNSALANFKLAKDKGLATFWTFFYADSEELKIDDCLMVLRYLMKNPEIKLDDCKKYKYDNYLLTVNKGEGSQGLVVLSKTGNEIVKTPFFYNIWIFEDTDEHHKYPYVNFQYSLEDTTNREVTFWNNRIELDVMEGINRIVQQNKGFKVKSARYNGDGYIYAIINNDQEQYSLMKITKAGKIIKSTPFTKEELSLPYEKDNKKININWRDKIYLVNSKFNIDITFTLYNFLLSNPDYRLTCWEAVLVNNSYLLLRVQQDSDGYYRYRWFRLSNTGNVLGRTTIEDGEKIQYDDHKSNFYNMNYMTGQRSEFGLEEMLKRFK